MASRLLDQMELERARRMAGVAERVSAGEGGGGPGEGGRYIPY